MKRQKLILVFVCTLISQVYCLGTTTLSTLLSDTEILEKLTSYLEGLEDTADPIPRQDDDDDEERTTRRDVFPGVASILLGVVSGDLRKVIEDGIFRLLPKGAQTQAFAVFHNLLGRTTLPPTTTTENTTTTRRRRSTAEAIKKTGSDTQTSTEPDIDTGFSTKPRRSTLKYHRITRIPAYRIRSKTSSTLETTTVKPKARKTTTEAFEGTDADPDPELEPEPEEDLVARFEEALRPHLPINPDDAVPKEAPQFI